MSLIPESSPLYELQGLENNWDGAGGLAPSPETKEHAQQFIDKLRLLFYDNQMPAVCPDRQGRLSFLWINAEDVSHELMIKFWFKNGIKAEWEMRLPDASKHKGKCTTTDRCVAVAAYYLMQIEEMAEKIKASLKP